MHTCAVLSGLDPNSEWATIKMFLQVVLHITGYILSINVFSSFMAIFIGLTSIGKAVQDNLGSCKGWKRNHDPGTGRTTIYVE